MDNQKKSTEAEPALHGLPPDEGLHRTTDEATRHLPVEVILQVAPTEPGILLFDEGDALFGKRTSVKDSHDRYAGS